MSATTAFTHTWLVGRFTATLTAHPRPGASELSVIEWAQHIPQRLTPEEGEAYRAGRDRAFGEMAQALGLNMALMEP